ncbi:hypothetical protein [Brevundimonas sp.]|uniref:hypothetical protein n=1 Tax=Brevundimonas sp. TaxID=1871086 RepID=UPI003BA9C673
MSATTWANLTWDEIAPGLRAVHRNGPAVALLARDAGKSPGDVTSIWLANAPAEVLPVLMFADGSMISMEGEGQL